MNGNVDLDALQSLLFHDNLSVDMAGAISQMIRKEKERRVLQVHKYKISGPFTTKKGQAYFTTRCHWTKSNKLNRNNYDDLIDELYDHYFANPLDQYSVQQIYEQMIEYYEKDNLIARIALA